MAKYPDAEMCRYDGNLHPLVASLPHYHKVPKDMGAQVAYRLAMRREAEGNPALQKEISKACADDALFFINSFCYILEPREGEIASGMIPFSTWVHQDPVIASIAHYFGRRHIIGDKSRAQGASWIMCALFTWAFLFRPNCILGLGSKDESSADDVDNPESLGWKVDFLAANLPGWMTPQIKRTPSKHTWVNEDNGAYIKAYAATAGIGRGGRFTAFFLDESAFFPPGSDRDAVANLVETTNGLIMISTPHGLDNEHYDRVHEPGPWLRVILDWKDNPVQNPGLYHASGGRLRIQDKEYEFDADYQHNLDGRIRSPWYDVKCDVHGGNMLYISQELDREYAGSKGRPFGKNILERALGLCKPPMHTGMIFYQEGEPWYTEGVSWVEGDAYKFDLWHPLDEDGFLEENDYVMGIDLSAGVGGETSSNSVMSIYERKTRTQVAEFAINTIPPVEFAQLAVAVAYWLGRGRPRTHLIWEKGGPGVPFTKEILRLQYPNVFYQHEGEELRHYAKKSDRPGYHNSNRMLVLSPLITSLTNGDATFRSAAMIEEAGQYVFDQNGKAHHPRSKTARDGSARGENHGDRPIAAGLAIMAMGTKHGVRRLPQSTQHVDRPVKYSIPWQIAKEKRATKGVGGDCRW